MRASIAPSSPSPATHPPLHAAQIITFRGHFGTIEGIDSIVVPGGLGGLALGPFNVGAAHIDDAGAAELTVLSLDSTTLKVREGGGELTVLSLDLTNLKVVLSGGGGGEGGAWGTLSWAWRGDAQARILPGRLEAPGMEERRKGRHWRPVRLGLFRV